MQIFHRIAHYESHVLTAAVLLQVYLNSIQNESRKNMLQVTRLLSVVCFLNSVDPTDWIFRMLSYPQWNNFSNKKFRSLSVKKASGHFLQNFPTTVGSLAKGPFTWSPQLGLGQPHAAAFTHLMQTTSELNRHHCKCIICLLVMVTDLVLSELLSVKSDVRWQWNTCHIM